MFKRGFKVVLLIGVFSLFAALFTYPAVFHLSEKLIGDGGDNLQFFGWMQIVLDNLAQGRWLFADTDIWRYPVGFAFSRGVDSYLLFSLGVMWRWLIANPVAHYNLVVLTLFVLNGILAYPLFRYVGKSRVLGVLGGLIYGFSFHSLARNGGHPNLMFTGGFPLFAYAWLRLKERKDEKKYLTLLGFSVLLTGLGSLQYLLILIGILPFLVMLAAIFFKEEVREYLEMFKRNFKFLWLIGLLFGGVFLVYAYPTVLALIKGKFVAGHANLENLYYWAPSLLDYIRPNAYLNLWYSNFFAGGGKVGVDFSIFVGFVELALFSLFAFGRIEKRVKRFLLSLIGVFFVFSLGVKSFDIGLFLPYALLVKVFPYWGVAESVRWYVVFYLLMVIGIIVYLRQLKPGSLERLVMIAGVFAIVLLERFSLGFALTGMQFFQEPFVGVVRRLPGEAVLDLPVDFTWATLGNSYDALAFYYNKKIVNGYIHWSVDTEESKQFIYDSTAYRFMCDNDNKKYIEGQDLSLDELGAKNKKLINELRDNGVRVLVVHKHPESHLYFDECTGALAQITRLVPQVVVIRDTAGPNALEARRFYKGKMHYRLYFPKGGLFRLNRAHYAYLPGNSGFRMFMNGEEVDTSGWGQHSSYEWGRWTRRTVPEGGVYSVAVRSGSVIEIIGDEYIEKEGFLNIDYEFDEDEGSIEVPMGNKFGPFEQVYDDGLREVWRIN